MLRDARRDGQEHQRTVQATVEWSCDLLSPEERELFDRLSVFTGSFDLQAVEAVCVGGAVDEFDAADLLDGLVDQSLVSLADPASARSRYRMLEPVRQFAEHSLVDEDVWHASHARHYTELADIGYEAMWTEGEAEWIERPEADFANHRVAYQYWADRGQLTEALTIAIALNQLGELALQRPAGAEILFVALDSKVSRHTSSARSRSPTPRQPSQHLAVSSVVPGRPEPVTWDTPPHSPSGPASHYSKLDVGAAADGGDNPENSHAGDYGEPVDSGDSSSGAAEDDFSIPQPDGLVLDTLADSGIDSPGQRQLYYEDDGYERVVAFYDDWTVEEGGWTRSESDGIVVFSASDTERIRTISISPDHTPGAQADGPVTYVLLIDNG